MMYQLTDDPDTVRCVETTEWVARGTWQWEQYEQFLLAGGVALPVAPPYELHSPQHYQAIRTAAWAWMTRWVQDRRYDTVESCCSYANSTVARYKGEALAMIQWRDDVNLALEQLVVNPPAGIETWDQVRLLLPQPEAYPWPGAVDLPLDTGDKVVLE